MRRLLSKGKGKGIADTTDAKQQMLAGRGRRSQVAIDGLVALLAFGKDSTDGFGLAEGVLGGILSKTRGGNEMVHLLCIGTPYALPVINT